MIEITFISVIAVMLAVYLVYALSEYNDARMLSNIVSKKVPDKKSFRSYEKFLTGQAAEDKKTVVRWLLAEFYRENAWHNDRFISKAGEYYSMLLESGVPENITEDAYFQLAGINLMAFSEFEKALEYYRALPDKIPSTKWRQVCEERAYVIERGLSGKELLKQYFEADRMFSEGAVEAGLEIFKKIFQENPESALAAPAAYFTADICNFKLQDYSEAIKNYRLVVHKYKEYINTASCQLKIGDCLRKLSKWQESVHEFKNFITMFSDHPHCDYAQYYIADGYERLNDLPNARIAYRLLLGNYPVSMWVDIAKLKISALERN